MVPPAGGKCKYPSFPSKQGAFGFVLVRLAPSGGHPGICQVTIHGTSASNHRNWMETEYWPS
jgi:hypothetical protein